VKLVASTANKLLTVCLEFESLVDELVFSTRLYTFGESVHLVVDRINEGCTVCLGFES
jgi:hypothetical protein